MCKNPEDSEAARTHPAGPRDLGHLQSFRAHRDGARNLDHWSAGIFSSTWLKLNHMGMDQYL